jgi:hypothetical protein
MAKNLLKIMGIMFLLTIPNNINESYFSKIEINSKKIEIKINSSKKSSAKEIKDYTSTELKEYKQKLKDIKDEIEGLNIKRNFFLDRLNKSDSFPIDSQRKKFYLKNLKETEKELNRYQYQKDSIYKLIKK